MTWRTQFTSGLRSLKPGAWRPGRTPPRADAPAVATAAAAAAAADDPSDAAATLPAYAPAEPIASLDELRRRVPVHLGLFGDTADTRGLLSPAERELMAGAMVCLLLPRARGSRSRRQGVLVYLPTVRGTVALQAFRLALGSRHKVDITAEHLIEVGALSELTARPTNVAERREKTAGTVFDRHIEAWILGAIQLNASDIHIRVRDSAVAGAESERSYVGFRVDGEIVIQEYLNPREAYQLVGALYAKCDGRSVARGEGAFQPGFRQAGFIRMPPSVRSAELRFQSAPERYGFDAVLRLLNYDGKALASNDFVQLGYLPDQIDLLVRHGHGPGGSVLFVGETGSGKTTSMTALLATHPGIVAGRQFAATVEDPPEGRILNVSQFPVPRSAESAAAENPFVPALRSLMRMDVDLIVLGEIRDAETAHVWQELNLTGHKLYATLHAPSAFGAIDRLTSRLMGLLPEAVAGPDMLACIVYQKLLPRLCPHCRIPAREAWGSDPALAARLDAYRTLQLDPDRFFVRNRHGCPHCRAGAKGVIVVAETLEPTARQRELIADAKLIDAANDWRAQRAARFDEPVTLGKTIAEVALYHVVEGVLAIDTVEEQLGRAGE
ncbi:MAG: Flp pilus assembly complex ATPase component TadA [Ideonella sp. WA131b]|jgi:type II secretory ATPase GspE/PulE/Tfp pilus assembly ATPase PilB-like protein|nr:Flp pilus assembly complex ATPase component TadA [Ideonella sp. WA131b]